MGPRFFKHGNQSQSVQAAADDRVFNGAALFQARKQNSANWTLAATAVFNGAALFQARKQVENLRVGKFLECLQWGRAFSSTETSFVETVVLHLNPFFNGAALFQARKQRS